jgi:hypothetical protein
MCRLWRLSTLPLLFFSLYFDTVYAHAQESSTCSDYSVVAPLGTTLASAGLFSNFWRRADSIAVKMTEAFQTIEQSIAAITDPGAHCPTSCHLTKQPRIIISSKARKLQNQYSDFQHCEDLYQSTKTKPLHYQVRNIKNFEGLAEWIEDFAQGHGLLGNQLYKDCDASCSPQYIYHIDKTSSSTYRIDAEVICGHARDREDTMYQLGYRLEWGCE